MENTITKKFFSEDNLYLFSKYMKKEIKDRVQSVWCERKLEEHVFLMSSGTTNSEKLKTYAISKNSILNNCRAVNKKFKLNENDIWLSSLPAYHIGGLSIFIRAELSRSKVVTFEEKWNPKAFSSKLENNNITACSLVPTQLFDIVAANLRPPSWLRLVFIGGDFLNSELAKSAIKLGWPIIVTFGMTECCSQLASSFFNELVDGHLEVLDNHHIIQDGNKNYLESNSLFTEEILINENGTDIFKCPKMFCLQDNISLITDNRGQFIKPLGRHDGHLKIKGRLYNFLELKNYWMNTIYELGLYGQVEVITINDDRDGVKLHGLFLNSIKNLIPTIIEKINLDLPEPVKLGSFELVASFNKTELGKIKSN